MDIIEKARWDAWSRVSDLIDHYVEKCAQPAVDIRRAIANHYTRGDVGVYWQPDRDMAALYFRGDQTKKARDLYLTKAAVSRVVGEDHIAAEQLTDQDLSKGGWVKVAASPTLRRIGELLNFFPGKYPGGIPNAPSPLAATLSGGLVGAGLGYGAGWLGEKLLPDRWQKGRLKKTLAALGGGLGAAPGAIGMLMHNNQGLSILDPGPLNAIDKEGCDLSEQYLNAADGFCKKAFGGFQEDRDPLAVNLNRMGQVLWDSGAPPQTTAATMNTLYAASRMPDPYAQPGQVTPRQTGLLGQMMGAAGGGIKGYAVGYGVGKTLGLLTGMSPSDQNMLANSGAALGIVNTLIPRMFN